jgi:ElaB/YqjD/DUF883 family membrane-anchored ribosome-binding protein
MPVASFRTHEVDSEPTVADRIVDAARHAAHFSHEARLVKSMAEDAIEDSVHVARRAMKSLRRGVEVLEDVKDEAAHRVRRQPLTTVGMAAGIGLLVGVALGWIGGRLGQRRQSCH